jgi:hypothetical protein
MAVIELAYDRMGSRLRAIGEHAIDSDRMGSRPTRVGSLALEYDRALGSRPIHVHVEGGDAGLGDDDLSILFLVLFELQRAAEAAG